MMYPFYYRRISKAFIEEVAERVKDGESIVLLGPRYSGKRYVIARLHEHLESEGINPLVEVQFLSGIQVDSEQEAVALISEAVAKTGVPLRKDERSTDGLFGPIDQLFLQTGKPVVLLAANVDSMPHHIARRFLECVRTRVEESNLIAVLSGEGDFRDLVHGPKSEFNCANQFVVQNFDKEQFKDFISRRIAPLNLSFESDEEMHRYLWALAEGNIYLLRRLLWKAVEVRSYTETPACQPLKISDIEASLKTLKFLNARQSSFLLYAVELIEREPECWDRLDCLIKGETVKVDSPNGAPTPLELAGVAIRDGEKLRFAFPWMKDFVQRYYNHRRFGDLYARDGNWDKALEHYKQLKPEEWLPSLAIDDRAEVELTVKAFCASLYSAASEVAESTYAVQQLFALGCRYALGFPHVTFWRYNQKWQHQPLDDLPISQDILNEVAKILPFGEVESIGQLLLASPLDNFAAAAILPSIREDQYDAVVIGDFEKRIVISHERERLMNDLLEHLFAAYEHAVRIERNRIRLEVRNKHMEIINAILDGLGKEVRNVGQTLEMAADGLVKLGFNRVFFSLVDPEGKRIQGVLGKGPSVKKMIKWIDWPLSDPEANIQPYVIHTRKSIIVPDASKEPLVDGKVVERTGVTTLAIVPMLNNSDNAIGTIHVERADGAAPSKEEVGDLEAFGRQLAIAIEQSERVNLLQSALDKIPEPVMIVDALTRPRYANEPAAKLFNASLGWQDRGDAAPLSGKEIGGMMNHLCESLQLNQREVLHIKGIGNQSEYRAEVLCDIIQNWRGKTVGALLHIEDLNYLYRMLEAFQLVAGATDTSSAMKAMLDATKLLGHQWGRLYLIDEHDPERLVSTLSFGFQDEENKKRFDVGGVDLLRRNEPGEKHSWQSIEAGAPLVFCWDEKREDGEQFFTAQGLKVINVRTPTWIRELEKKQGNFWLDFPLMTPEGPLGKLTLQCDENLRPENFELLKVLSEMTAGLLDAFIRRDSAFKQRELWIQEAAEKTMAVTAHNIATRLAALPVLLTRYRVCEKHCVGLKVLNNDFAHILEETLEIIKRMKELLKPVIVQPSTFDIVSRIEKTLRSALDDHVWSIKCSEPSLEVRMDAHLLETALLELIQNSKEAVTNSETIVNVKIESVKHGKQEMVRIVYTDNGPGVPEHLKERIFANFFSYRPGRKTGTGLGLGFVHRVVKAHGGTIRECGEPDEGAKFVIEIPRFVKITETKE